MCNANLICLDFVQLFFVKAKLYSRVIENPTCHCYDQTNTYSQASALEHGCSTNGVNPQQPRLHLLATVGAALGELGLTTSRLAENSGAGAAGDNGLSVGEDGGHLEAALATDIHEVTAGSRDKLLKLVLLSFRLSARVKNIDSQNHYEKSKEYGRWRFQGLQKKSIKTY